MKYFKKLYIQLIYTFVLILPLITYADLPSIEDIPYQYVSTEDPDVIAVANFAVKQIQRGSLSRIILAQKQASEDTTYYLLLDLVDAHIRHHHYSVLVLIPNDGSKWQIENFSAVNY